MIFSNRHQKLPTQPHTHLQSEWHLLQVSELCLMMVVFLSVFPICMEGLSWWGCNVRLFGGFWWFLLLFLFSLSSTHCGLYMDAWWCCKWGNPLGKFARTQHSYIHIVKRHCWLRHLQSNNQQMVSRVGCVEVYAVVLHKLWQITEEFNEYMVIGGEFKGFG